MALQVISKPKQRSAGQGVKVHQTDVSRKSEESQTDKRAALDKHQAEMIQWFANRLIILNELP